MKSFIKNSFFEQEEPCSEVFKPNSWYGSAKILKEYACWPLALPFVVPHGVELSEDFVWDQEVNNHCIANYYFPFFRKKAYKNKSKNLLIPGCSPWLYLCENLEASGRVGMVAFPPHSSHHVFANADDQRYSQLLKKLKRKYKTIQICLYWKDFEHKRNLFYEKAGFKVICAGHMFDEDFLTNLLKILKKYEFMHTTEIGSHIFYGAAAGCKVILNETIKNSYIASKKILARDVPRKKSKYYYETKKIFSSNNFSHKKKYALKILGLKYKLSKVNLFILILKISLKKNFLMKKSLPLYLQNIKLIIKTFFLKKNCVAKELICRLISTFIKCPQEVKLNKSITFKYSKK